MKIKLFQKQMFQDLVLAIFLVSCHIGIYPYCNIFFDLLPSRSKGCNYDDSTVSKNVPMPCDKKIA